MQEKKLYGTLIFQLRGKKKITLECLSIGLCTPSMLAKIEKGERYPDNLLRERLLGRLGVTKDDYETYLNIDEYNDWVLRKDIIECIENKDIIGAEERLTQYALEHNAKSALEQQFYLVMRLQIMKHKKCSGKEMFSVVEEALKLTVPLERLDKCEELVLSVQEMNLLLEYYRYGEENKRVKNYQKLKSYILTVGFDSLSIAKLYPKLIYLLCKEYSLKESKMSILHGKKTIELCDEGLESLKVSKSMFYMWELLFLKKQVLERLFGMSSKLTAEEKSIIANQLEETKQNEQIVSELYAIYEQQKEMLDDCYLYWETEVCCISDMIRTRRRMLGMSREKLSNGICSLKTLERLETRQTNTQEEIVRLLFQRLNLPPTKYRTEIITTKQYDNELVLCIRNCINEKEYMKAERLLGDLELSLNMEEVVNRQFVERFQAISDFRTGRIDKTEYVKRMQEALSHTLPMEAIENKKEFYLTNLEVGCFYNLTCALENSNAKKAIYLRKMTDMGEKLEKNYRIHFPNYELMLTMYASYLGNEGRYEESDEVSRELIKKCIKNRKLFVVSRNIYNIYWNYKKRNELLGAVNPKYDAKKMLWSSIILCQLAGQENDKNFLEREWKRIDACGYDTGI